MTDPFVIADYHLMDDLISGDTTLDKTNRLISKHNKFITKNDDVIYLGDLSGDEVYQKNNQHLLKDLKEKVLQLNHKRFIFVIGNNDRIEFESFYKECGFNQVYGKPVILSNPELKPFGKESKLIFSHEPVDLIKEYPDNNENILNIHGHIHGTKKYYNCDPKNHIDVWYGLYPHPMRLSEIINFYNSGKYNGLSRVNN